MNIRPLVVVILGSETDQADFKSSGVFGLLESAGVRCEVWVCSAHRNDEMLGQLCTAKMTEGALVFIAFAGKLGVLGGAIVAKIKAARPVIAVGKMPQNCSVVDELASLLATVDLPRYTPMGSTGLGSHGLINAGLLALQIIGFTHPSVQVRCSEILMSRIPDVKQLEFPVT